MTRDDAAVANAGAVDLFNARHGLNLSSAFAQNASPSSLVDAAYSQLLGLSGDFTNAAERKGYWIDQLQSGALSTADFADEFLFQAENVPGRLDQQAVTYNQAAVPALTNATRALLQEPDAPPSLLDRTPLEVLASQLLTLGEVAAEAGRLATAEVTPSAFERPFGSPPDPVSEPAGGPVFRLTHHPLDQVAADSGLEDHPQAAHLDAWISQGPTPQVAVANGADARVPAGQGLEGVVMVATDSAYGSGVLMPGGQAVLTAAHVVEGQSPVTVRGEIPAGEVNLTTSAVSIHPGYDTNTNHDIALVWLDQRAPAEMPRVSLYRDADERGQVMSLSGFGQPGDQFGPVERSASPVKRAADNRFDIAIDDLTAAFNLDWSPSPGTQLLIDFDNGRPAQDAFGQLLGIEGTGVPNEGFITSGDSGGPALLDGKVAGIASYTISLTSQGLNADINGDLDGSAGEIGAFQRISHYQQWIDQRLRDKAPQAPTHADEIHQVLTAEQQAEDGMAYFLIELSGEIPDDGNLYRVDVATRDGSATAHDDYLPLDTSVVFYPGGRRSVAVGVELLEDREASGEEAFYLDVSNPSGGELEGGTGVLTAVRTLLDDGATLA